MKIQCTVSSLAEAVSVVSRAAAAKSTIPITEGILLRTVDDNMLQLTGYDMNMGMRTTIAIRTSQPGSVVVSPKLLLDILRKLPGEDVSLETNADHKLIIRSGVILFSILVLDAENFPELPIIQNETAVELPQKMLRSMIAGTIFSVSDNQTKPILTGSLFQFYGRLFSMVSLDHFRMSVRQELVERDDSAPNLRFVVPGRTLRELERSLNDTDEPVTLCLTKKNILFQCGSLLLISKLLEGEYLTFENALPNNTDYIYRVNTHSIIDSLERIGIIISDTQKTRTACTFSDNTLKVSCVTSTSHAYDETPVNTVAGDGEVQISFNNRYLLEALRAANAANLENRDDENADEVELCMSARLNSCVLRPIGHKRYTYLILPIRPVAE